MTSTTSHHPRGFPQTMKAIKFSRNRLRDVNKKHRNVNNSSAVSKWFGGVHNDSYSALLITPRVLRLHNYMDSWPNRSLGSVAVVFMDRHQRVLQKLMSDGKDLTCLRPLVDSPGTVFYVILSRHHVDSVQDLLGILHILWAVDRASHCPLVEIAEMTTYSPVCLWDSETTWSKRKGLFLLLFFLVNNNLPGNDHSFEWTIWICGWKRRHWRNVLKLRRGNQSNHFILPSPQQYKSYAHWSAVLHIAGLDSKEGTEKNGKHV